MMSKTKNPPVYYRSKRYDVIDLYKTDGNMLLDQMIKRQSINRCYNPEASYLKYRAGLIQFVENIAEQLEYSHCTLYLAIGLLDYLLSEYSIEKKQLKLVGFMVLHLAAKVEESDLRIPTVAAIRTLFDSKYSEEDIIETEAMISSILNFCLDLKTPYRFIEYFLSRGVLSDQDIGKAGPEATEKQLCQFETTIMELLDMTVLSYEFYRFDPLTIAAASIYCSRRLHTCEYSWPEDLQKLTRKSFKDIEICVNLMQRHYQMKIDKDSSNGRTDEKSKENCSNSNKDQKTEPARSRGKKTQRTGNSGSYDNGAGSCSTDTDDNDLSENTKGTMEVEN